MAQTADGRAAFAESCATFITKHGFDGVDLDWEYPVERDVETNARNPDDGRHYTLLCREIRSCFDRLSRETGRRYWITLAVPAHPDLIRHYELPALSNVVDFVNLMAYDYRGSWSTRTGHHAPLFHNPADTAAEVPSVQHSIECYMNGGMPSHQLVLGIPLYGRGFSNVPKSHHGLFQPFTGVPRGTWDEHDATGVFDYKDIIGKRLPVFWDDHSKASWTYDAENGVMLTFESIESATSKAHFIREARLGGAMFWDLSGDTRDKDSLIAAVKTHLDRK
jgi:chitinase